MHAQQWPALWRPPCFFEALRTQVPSLATRDSRPFCRPADVVTCVWRALRVHRLHRRTSGAPRPLLVACGAFRILAASSVVLSGVGRGQNFGLAVSLGGGGGKNGAAYRDLRGERVAGLCGRGGGGPGRMGTRHGPACDARGLSAIWSTRGWRTCRPTSR